jgi:hypothetical protein
LLAEPAAEPGLDDAMGAEAGAPKPLAQACPCCGGRMIIIETFTRGATPRYRPSAPTPIVRIDTS